MFVSINFLSNIIAEGTDRSAFFASYAFFCIDEKFQKAKFVSSYIDGILRADKGTYSATAASVCNNIIVFTFFAGVYCILYGIA